MLCRLMLEIAQQWMNDLEEIRYVRRNQHSDNPQSINTSPVFMKELTKSLKVVLVLPRIERDIFLISNKETDDLISLHRETLRVDIGSFYNIKDIKSYDKHFIQLVAENYEKVRSLMHEGGNVAYASYPLLFLERENEDGFMERNSIIFDTTKKRRCVCIRESKASLHEHVNYVMLMRRFDKEFNGKNKKLYKEARNTNKAIELSIKK